MGRLGDGVKISLFPDLPSSLSFFSGECVKDHAGRHAIAEYSTIVDLINRSVGLVTGQRRQRTQEGYWDEFWMMDLF
jgi:hypothetical protein